MKYSFVFDVDGTLTPNRQKMDDSFAWWFEMFCSNQNVHLITGSDIEKLKEQVPLRILKSCESYYTCAGNEKYVDEKLIYRNDINVPIGFVNEIETIVKNSLTPVRTSNHIEFRQGMINFSTIGRNSTIEQRKQYSEWDKLSKERQTIKETLSNLYPELEFNIGGEISIDVYNKGFGKEQIVDQIDSPIAFFGDRMSINGNDRGLAIKCLDKQGSIICNVENWEQTQEILYKWSFF